MSIIRHWCCPLNRDFNGEFYPAEIRAKIKELKKKLEILS
jgi:hypothetical protein